LLLVFSLFAHRVLLEFRWVPGRFVLLTPYPVGALSAPTTARDTVVESTTDLNYH